MDDSAAKSKDANISRENKILRKARTDLARNRSKLPTPIHRLALEVLEQIFLMNPRCTFNHSLDRIATLLRVCRSWRQLALTMPSLWSHIDLAFGGD